MGLTQLSGLDASFLYLETGRSFGHVSSILILDRPDDPSFDPYHEYRARMERAVHDYLPLRRRLVEVPFGLDHPYWAEDPDFDLDFHVRHVAVPPPGGRAELDSLVARSIGRPLDRNKPLWEAYVIEGLENDQFAIFTKMHHSTIDGAAGAMLTQQMFSEGAVVDLREDVPPLPKPDPLPRPTDVLNKAMFDLARRPRRMFRWQRELAKELFRVGRSSEDRSELAGSLPGVPRTPFNAAITPNRRFTWRAIPLSEVKAIKTALGCTVNDVVMAMCAGALRNYLLEHDALPDDPLVAMVPVSIRTGDEVDPWTNRVSSIFVTIPTDVDDRAGRIAAIGATMAEGKHRHDLLPADLIVEAASIAPGLIAHTAARIAMNPRIANAGRTPANVTISNVPGPRDLLSLGDAPVRHYVPVSTVVDGQGLNITVQSYSDTLDLGLVSCRELIPDLDRLAELHMEEFAALKELAGLPRDRGRVSARHDDLIARLEASADPAKAPGQQDYMKSELPFHGVAVPEVRKIAKAVGGDHPFADRDDWERGVLEIWRGATHREQMYAATEIAILTPCRPWLDGQALSMIEEMIVTGSWWDHVDALAANHMGLMLTNDPDTIRPVMWAWATDDMDRNGAMWRRRTSILCQLKLKATTDVDLLFHAIESSMDSREFFLRKAIGWALREYAETDPDEVLAFVDRHADRLSGLSKREALKHLR